MEQQQLHRMSQLASVLKAMQQAATDPKVDLFYSALSGLCRTLSFSGAVVMLDEGTLQTYSFHTSQTSVRHVDDVMPRPDDWMVRSMNSAEVIQLSVRDYNESGQLASSVVPGSEQVMVMPIEDGGQITGALAVGASIEFPIDDDTEVVLRTFVDYLLITLDIQRNHKSVHEKNILIDAYRHFIEARTIQELTFHLYEATDLLPSVQGSLVWLRDGLHADRMEPIVNAANLKAVEQFQTATQTTEYFERLFETLRDSLDPIQIDREDSRHAPVQAVFDQMNTQTLLALPLMNTAFVLGVVFVAPYNVEILTQSDIDLFQVINYAAGQSIERNSFVQLINEKTAWLEAILNNVSEGAFFVDEDGLATYVNPQFTALTDIPPSNIVGFDAQAIFRDLTDSAVNGVEIYNQLIEGLDNIPDDERIVVELRSQNGGADLYLEIVPVEQFDGEVLTWVGLVRESRSVSADAKDEQISLLRRLPEYVRLHQRHAESLLQTLIERQDRIDSMLQRNMLRDLEAEMTLIGAMCDDVSNLTSIQSRGTSSGNTSPLTDVIDNAFDHKEFNGVYTHFSADRPDTVPIVRGETSEISEAIARMMSFISRFATPDKPVPIYLRRVGDYAHLVFEYDLPEKARRQFDHAMRDFESQQSVTINILDYLSLRLGHEMLEQSGCSVTLKADGFTIAIPATSEDVSMEVIETGTLTAPPGLDDRMRAAGMLSEPEVEVKSAPMREPDTVVVFEGHSQLTNTLIDVLETADYNLYIYPPDEDGLWHLTTATFDIVVLDAYMSERDAMSICREVRSKTEKPIIMLADTPSVPDKVEAFNIGVDEYISQPIEPEELLARVQAIFKRIQITDRSSEPIVIEGLRIDLARRSVSLNSEPIELTRIEYALLRHLAINKGQVLEHEQLLSQVWGPEYRNEKQQLWVNISRLRKKLEPYKDSRRYVHTRSGVGYVLR